MSTTKKIIKPVSTDCPDFKFNVAYANQDSCSANCPNWDTCAVRMAKEASV